MNVIVAGPYLIWSTTRNDVELVGTPKDLDIFTHIIYLAGDVNRIAQQRREDAARADRPDLTAEQLQSWQDQEITQLRSACYENNVLFNKVSNQFIDDQAYLLELINSAARNKEHPPVLSISSSLDRMLCRPLRAVLVFDGDQTLASLDSGKPLLQQHSLQDLAFPQALKEVFKKIGHTEQAFKQVALGSQPAYRVKI